MLLLGFLLLFEAVLTGMWIARLLPTIGIYDVVALIVMANRAVVGAAELLAWWLIRTKRPLAIPLTRIVLVASAVLTTLEIGWRLAPSNIDPAWRWWYVGGYWVYASFWLVYLRPKSDRV